MKTIRFIRREGNYSNVVNSIVDPIAKHLPDNSYIVQGVSYNHQLGKWTNEKDVDYFDISLFVESISYQHEFFISHGIADKSWRNADKMKPFNYVGVSGGLWVDKLVKEGLNRNKIKIIGYPKLDELFETRKSYERESNVIKVLYAPTHNTNPSNQKSVSSYPRLMPYLNMPDDIQLTVSCHPVNSSTKITYDELVNTDVVISDSGSLIYEAWALDIPVVFPDWIVKSNIQRTFHKSFEDYIYTNGVGYHANNIGQLISLIRVAYDKGLDKQTQNFIEGIFPRNLHGNSGKVTADILLDLVARS